MSWAQEPDCQAGTRVQPVTRDASGDRGPGAQSAAIGRRKPVRAIETGVCDQSLAADSGSPLTICVILVCACCELSARRRGRMLESSPPMSLQVPQACQGREVPEVLGWGPKITGAEQPKLVSESPQGRYPPHVPPSPASPFSPWPLLLPLFLLLPSSSPFCRDTFNLHSPSGTREQRGRRCFHTNCVIAFFSCLTTHSPFPFASQAPLEFLRSTTRVYTASGTSSYIL